MKTVIEVVALQSVNILAAGQLLRLVAGETYLLPEDEAKEFMRAGIVTVRGVSRETAAVAPTEQAVAPKAKRKPQRGKL